MNKGQITKGSPQPNHPRSSIVWLLFAVVTIFVYFFGLTLPLLGPDEPRYAQVAREMFERGDWITPTLGGYNWFEKPVLLYWLQISSYNIFGVTEFAARFGSALCGIGTVISLWILGRSVEQDNTANFANWLALIAGSTIGIIAFAHGASFDIILTFPITAAMVSFYIYDRRAGSNLLPLVSFYFFIGLALLAKGLVGIVFPFVIVGLYFLFLRRWPRKEFLLSLLWGALVSAAIAAIWYVPMYLRHGYEFVDQFFIQHHFQRYTSNKYLHPQPFYFFFWVLPLMVIPWTPMFFVAMWSLAKRAFLRVARGQNDIGDSAKRDEGSLPDSLAYFALAWLALPLVFFSFSGSKLPGYVLPAVPAAIILTAIYVYRFIQKGSWRGYLVQTIAAGTFAVVIVAMALFVPAFAESDSVKRLFTTAHARGFDDLPVFMLHGISHNAEFYATGPIVRDAEGKQKKFFGPPEVFRELRTLGRKQGLVLVPLQYLDQVINSDLLTAEVLKDNGELALVFVTEK